MGETVLCLHTATGPGRGPCLTKTVWTGRRVIFCSCFGTVSRNRKWDLLGRDSPEMDQTISKFLLLCKVQVPRLCARSHTLRGVTPSNKYQPPTGAKTYTRSRPSRRVRPSIGARTNSRTRTLKGARLFTGSIPMTGARHLTDARQTLNKSKTLYRS